MRNHLAPYLGRHAIGDLTPAVIRTWRATRLEAGASALQVAKAYRLLRAILNTAVDDQRIRTNPCQIKGAGEERSPERSVVDIATVYALADAMEAREPRYRLLVLLAAFGSLRWNELIGLQRRDLNTKTGQVMVRQQRIEPDKGATFDGDPKSRSKRTVTLPSEVLPEVRRHLRLYVRRHPDAYVFVGPKGARPRRSNFSVIWSHVRDQVGRPDLHLHDLRHTGNQFASDTGANLRQLMARMGHSSTRAALIYLHATEDRDQAIAAGLDTMIRASRSGTGVARTEEKSIKKATTRSKKKAPGQRRGSESG
jgi:integrase